MNFKEYKKSLKYRKYKNWKIIIRFIEYKVKDLLIDIIIKLNIFKSKSKPIIDLGSYSDNRFINFFIFSLKKEYHFTYEKDQNAKKLYKRIGFINFFKHTVSKKEISNRNIKIIINKKINNKNEICIDTNYFKYFYDKDNDYNKNNLLMPYYMYPRIYNSFYSNISINEKPNFNLRIYFSGSVVEEGYKSFFWKKEPDKFPNRIKIINKILDEFKSEIFLINSKQDLKSSLFSKKKIIFCLHDKMIKKTSYILDFKNNFNLLNSSCFNLNCPGVVMPLCHHLIEGIKVGSIPITNCDKLISPNLNNENSLNYSNIDELMKRFYEALKMEEEKIIYMRSRVFEYYKNYLSPENFKINFQKILKDNNKKIICCDDHRSVNKIF